jgi:hypothetical protein
MLADYLSQPRCVVPVNRRDNRLPFPHFVAGPQRHAGGLISAGTFQEFGAQFLLHAEASALIAVRERGAYVRDRSR